MRKELARSSLPFKAANAGGGPCVLLPVTFVIFDAAHPPG